MVHIRPFRAFRPKPQYASQTAALPYDVVSTKEAREIVKGNPYSFLHIDKAEIDLDEAISSYDEKVYVKARENLEKMIEEHILIQDDHRCLYIYSLTRNEHSQVGLVACSSVADYENLTIKKHELTRHDKELDRIRHIETTNAQIGPIFMTYKDHADVHELLLKWMSKHESIYSFVAEDEVSHKVWKIDDKETISILQAKFVDIDSTYIADGHHRTASAVRIAEQRKLLNPYHTGEEDYNYFLSVLFPASQVEILDYNRVVSSLNGLTDNQLLVKIAERFQLKEVGTMVFKPKEKHTIGMYLSGKWYKLTVKERNIKKDDLVKKLDVAILQDELLEPILGIKDIRLDERIDFIGGVRGISALKESVDSGKAKVAFSLFPPSIEELIEISDANKLMPPKSTWFEPKLRTGLFIHVIDS